MNQLDLMDVVEKLTKRPVGKALWCVAVCAKRTGEMCNQPALAWAASDVLGLVSAAHTNHSRDCE